MLSASWGKEYYSPPTPTLPTLLSHCENARDTSELQNLELKSSIWREETDVSQICTLIRSLFPWWFWFCPSQRCTLDHCSIWALLSSQHVSCLTPQLIGVTSDIWQRMTRENICRDKICQRGPWHIELRPLPGIVTLRSTDTVWIWSSSQFLRNRLGPKSKKEPS